MDFGEGPLPGTMAYPSKRGRRLGAPGKNQSFCDHCRMGPTPVQVHVWHLPRKQESGYSQRHQIRDVIFPKEYLKMGLYLSSGDLELVHVHVPTGQSGRAVFFSTSSSHHVPSF